MGFARRMRRQGGREEIRRRAEVRRFCDEALGLVLPGDCEVVLRTDAALRVDGWELGLVAIEHELTEHWQLVARRLEPEARPALLEELCRLAWQRTVDGGDGRRPPDFAVGPYGGVWAWHTRGRPSPGLERALARDTEAGRLDVYWRSVSRETASPIRR